MTEIIVRPACSEDLEHLNELMFCLHNEHHVQCPDYFKSAEDIEADKSIAQYLDHPECLVFVATIDSDIVGFVSGHFCELVSPVSQPLMMGSIDELYVKPARRHQSIAGDLMDRVESVFKQYGIKEIFVEVWDFNVGARTFYQNSGFTQHIHWLRKSIK
ncbi:GNAT family N-acetyltransferase [Vibrio palustris]|uniref:Putative acetyltransferase n=1 Tax=Vibrio palustris TaxID=1918946 RepID=A0A1R4B2N3_9VIBR|nr:GNAT family N-acetyltransferase [Vibrio palustris]SJL83156.1 putative acetyltransferase [Vibrio palustris]